MSKELELYQAFIDSLVERKDSMTAVSYTHLVEEIFEDPSEQEVLWHIQTQLDKELVEPFHADYQAIIEEARRAVTEQY